MKAVLTSVIVGSIVVAAGALTIGFLDAANPDPIYGRVENFSISRHPDADGTDRIYIDAAIQKLVSCDLESGDGPPWVDFYDGADGGVPPPSAFYRPDGLPTGTTLGKPASGS